MADQRAELRRLLLLHKQQQSAAAQSQPQPQARVADKLAKYDAGGRLSCIICKLVVADGGWQQHVSSRQHVHRLRELKELAASRKAEADAAKVAGFGAATSAVSAKPPAEVATASQLRIEQAPLNTLSVPGSERAASPRPTSPAPHNLPLQIATASALPADFFDPNDESDTQNEGESGGQLHQLTTASSAAELPSSASADFVSVSTSSTVLHPSAQLPQAGAGEQLSAVLDVDQRRAEDAGAEAERERRDTEAAIALAIAMSNQQSTPSFASAAAASSPRPVSPLPAPAAAAAGPTAVSLPDALEAFEAELAVAEAEVKERSAEEERRLAAMRRDEDEIEEEERKQRLEDIKQRVAEAKRKREQRQPVPMPAPVRADEGGTSSKRKRRRQQTAESESPPGPHDDGGDDGDLMAELDGMFDWRRQQR